MKITINQLDEELNEKNFKIKQLKTEGSHHQFVNKHEEPTNTNKISVGTQANR